LLHAALVTPLVPGTLWPSEASEAQFETFELPKGRSPS
jgi:hypothetical protein